VVHIKHVAGGQVKGLFEITADNTAQVLDRNATLMVS